jgi:hypothetical protein
LAKIPGVQEISGSISFSLWPKVSSRRHLVYEKSVHSRVSRTEESPMSFVAWKILRKLPKPLLLVGLVFVLVAAARA